MDDLEQNLRTRTNVDELLELKINSLEEGHEALNKIDGSARELLMEMREGDFNNKQSEAYNNVRYDLKTARHHMHVQMARFVKLKRRG